MYKLFIAFLIYDIVILAIGIYLMARKKPPDLNGVDSETIKKEFLERYKQGDYKK